MGFKLSDLSEATKAFFTDIFHLRTTGGIDKRITGENLAESFIQAHLTVTATTTIDLSQYECDLFVLYSGTAAATITLSNALPSGRSFTVMNVTTQVLTTEGGFNDVVIGTNDICTLVSTGYTMRLKEEVSRSLSLQSSALSGLIVDSLGTNDVGMQLNKSGVLHWFLALDTSTGNLVITRHDSSTGAFIDTPFSIIQSTGKVNLTGDLQSGNIFIDDKGVNANNPTLKLRRLTSGTEPTTGLEIVIGSDGDSAIIPLDELGAERTQRLSFDTATLHWKMIGEFDVANNLNALGNLYVSGDITIDGGTGGDTSISPARIELGEGRTADGTVYMDFKGDTTYTDYGLRLIRGSGANGYSQLIHRGTGDLLLLCSDSANIKLDSDNLYVTGHLEPMTATTEGTQTLSPGVNWVVPRGVYTFGVKNTLSNVGIYCSLGSEWLLERLLSKDLCGQIISDGTNYMLRSPSSSDTVYWRKH